MTFRQSADKRMARATVATPGRRLVAGDVVNHPNHYTKHPSGKLKEGRKSHEIYLH
jgi:hypothetical protein